MFSLNEIEPYSPKNVSYDLSYPEINEMTSSDSDGKETENQGEVKEEGAIPLIFSPLHLFESDFLFPSSYPQELSSETDFDINFIEQNQKEEMNKKLVFEVEEKTKTERKNQSKKCRRDYTLKRFKKNCMKYVMNNLNKNLPKKYHLYLPNSLEFTSVITYTDNRKWFNWTIMEIITTYGTKKKGSNKKKLEKIENSPILGDNLAYLQKILLKSFKEVIVDYSHSDAFKRDVQLLPLNQKSFYNQLGGNSEFSYINITLNGKTL